VARLHDNLDLTLREATLQARARRTLGGPPGNHDVSDEPPLAEQSRIGGSRLGGDGARLTRPRRARNANAHMGRWVLVPRASSASTRRLRSCDRLGRGPLAAPLRPASQASPGGHTRPARRVARPLAYGPNRLASGTPDVLKTQRPAAFDRSSVDSTTSVRAPRGTGPRNVRVGRTDGICPSTEARLEAGFVARPPRKSRPS
jgi:hypothetical protein